MRSIQSNMPVSVLLIDANETFLRIMSRLLTEHYSEQLHIVGTATGNADALQHAQQTQPAIILLGMRQHSMPELRIIPRLQALVPGVGIIVLGALDIAVYRKLALDAGAHAFIAKSAINSELLTVIERLTRAARS